jgi:octaprenyl-diphosphate synthase
VEERAATTFASPSRQRRKRTTETASQARAEVAQLYAPVAQPLAQVEELLAKTLRSQVPFVDELVQHAFHLGGKRLRPALLLLTAQACGRISPEHIVLGAVVEMIHTATLVHDDVLDEAKLRRHIETVNARWDNEASVLVGDFLFTHAFHLASTLETTHACRLIGHSTNVVCEGELRQVHNRGNLALDETEYFEIIDAKTAELVACCCALGAHYAGADASLEQALASYGRSLGIAFQIVDDLLDLWGDEATTGKSLGSDVQKQKLTLPVIHLLAQSSVEEQRSLRALLERGDEESMAELRGRLDSSGARRYAEQVARRHVEQARLQLEGLPPSDAKDVLCGLTYFVLERQR